MKLTASSFLLVLAATYANAHGDHHGSGALPGETIQQYAQRHMSSEHHIDDFDVRSFFHLHDLNRDGSWDREEIEAIYGVHHIYSKKKSSDEEAHKAKADKITSTVLNLVDLNKDGFISVEEFEKVGLSGLPNFDELGAEGHHYDVESEFFLHHEEQYHNTPETQTDESYNHPEDLEHFAHHEAIERKEAIKEAEFEGLTLEEVLKAHEHDGETIPIPVEEQSQPGEEVTADSTSDEPVQVEVEPIVNLLEGLEPGSAAYRAALLQMERAKALPRARNQRKEPVKVERETRPEMRDPEVKYADASREKQKVSEWGTGEEGYKAPIKPVEKMRKNLPYKYKFKRNWGDF